MTSMPGVPSDVVGLTPETHPVDGSGHSLWTALDHPRKKTIQLLGTPNDLGNPRNTDDNGNVMWNIDENGNMMYLLYIYILT